MMRLSVSVPGEVAGRCRVVAELRARPQPVRPCARNAQLALRAQTVRFAPAGTLRSGRCGSLALRHAPTRHRPATSQANDGEHATRMAHEPYTAKGWRGGEVSSGGAERGRWRSAATGPRSPHEHG